MPDKTEFKQVFEELKSIFKPYAKRWMSRRTDTYYILNVSS